jgi:hypothetical protein
MCTFFSALMSLPLIIKPREVNHGGSTLMTLSNSKHFPKGPISKQQNWISFNTLNTSQCAFTSAPSVGRQTRFKLQQSDLWPAHIFSHSLSCHCTLLVVYFSMKKVFSLIQSHLSVFAFSYLRVNLPTPWF